MTTARNKFYLLLFAVLWAITAAPGGASAKDAQQEDPLWPIAAPTSMDSADDAREGAIHQQLQLSSIEQEWLRNHPEVNIYVNSDLFPYAFVKEGGGADGVVVDVANAVGELLGIELNIIPSQYRQLIEFMREGAVHGLALVDPGDYPYKAPYLTSTIFVSPPYSMFVSKGSGYKPAALEDFKGNTVALHQGSAQESPIYQAMKGNRIVFVESVLDGVKMVIEGKVDGFLEVYAPVAHVIQTHFFTDIDAAVITDLRYYGSFIIRNDLKELYACIEKALNIVIQKDLPGILQKWHTYLRRPPDRRQLQLTEEERAWLNDHRTISVGVEHNWAPIEYMDRSDSLKGLSSGYLRRLEGILGVRFQPVTADSRAAMVENDAKRQPDMFACVVKTPRRAAYLDFTRPYLSLPVVIFSRRERSYIGRIDQLEARSVAVLEGHATHDIISKNNPGIELVTVRDTEAALKALGMGEVEAFIGCLLTGSHYIAKEGLLNLKVAGETPYRYDLAMAGRKDWPLLTGILQKALDTISEEERAAIYNRWIKVNYEQSFDYSILWEIGGVALLILSAFGYWNRRLAREVAQRRRTEAELFESRATYKNLFDNLIDVYYRTDAKGRFIMLSPSIEALLGYQPEELLGVNVADLYVDRKKRDLLTQRLMNEKWVEGFETRLKTKNGSVIWASTNAKLLRDQTGHVLGIEGLTRDITEHKRIEKALRESELQYRVIFDNSPLGILQVDPQGTITYCNDMAIELFRSSRRSLMGFNLPRQLLNEKFKEADKIARSGKTTVFEGSYTSVTGNKTSIFRVIFNPIEPGHSPSACIVTIEDIAERIEAEKKLKAALAEKEVLLREIHHRVKNSMQVMSGLLQLQCDRMDDRELKQAFEDSQNRIIAMALVHQILYQSENLAHINLSDYLQRLSQALQSALDGNQGSVTLAVHAQDILLGLEVAVPCGLAINELLSNSYKHAFPQGCAGQITVEAYAAGNGEASIVVSDNGVGLPSDLDLSGSNSLGLYLVSGLVETQLGGKLRMENQNGARISLRFNVKGGKVGAKA